MNIAFISCVKTKLQHGKHKAANIYITIIQVFFRILQKKL